MFKLKVKFYAQGRHVRVANATGRQIFNYMIKMGF